MVSGTDGNNVRVRARWFGTIYACLQFEETGLLYDEHEKQTHVNNLTGLLKLELARSSADYRDFYWNVCLNDLDEFHYLPWVLFCKSHGLKLLLARGSRKCPLMRFMVEDHFIDRTPRTTYLDVLNTQIALGNLLAKQQQLISDASHDAEGKKVSVRWCNSKVKANDIIVLCEGVQLPLIVRPDAEETNQV